MLKRIITAIVAIAIFVPVCVFSNTIFFPIAIAILSFVGVFEMSKCLGFHKNLWLTIPLYIIALGAPIFRIFVTSNTFFLAHIPVVFISMLIYILAYVMLRKNKDNLSDVLTLYALCIFVIAGFTSIVLVRAVHNGAKIYLLAFLGAWICDTFAYFTGKFFGKHKLIPEISPKKTIEGSVGGIVFTIGGFAIYGLIMNTYFEADLSYLTLCIYGLILSIISQFGDLIASSIKRQYNLKDYGFIFPGHGGVLDRFDGVLLVAPTLYVLNHFIG